MNKLFIDDLVERLETATCTIIKKCDQKEVSFQLKSQELYDQFPMISYEYTSDSQFQVEPQESQFLNDIFHKGTWLIGSDDDTINFIINLQSNGQSLFIDAIEVNKDMRGDGLGGTIVTVIESIAEQYYSKISISPFDTDAMNFWKHMGYSEDNIGNLVKYLNEEGDN